MRLRATYGGHFCDPEIHVLAVSGRNPASGRKLAARADLYFGDLGERERHVYRRRVIRDLARLVLAGAKEEATWGEVHGSTIYEEGGHGFFDGEPPVLPDFREPGIYPEEA